MLYFVLFALLSCIFILSLYIFLYCTVYSVLYCLSQCQLSKWLWRPTPKSKRPRLCMSGRTLNSIYIRRHKYSWWKIYIELRVDWTGGEFYNVCMMIGRVGCSVVLVTITWQRLPCRSEFVTRLTTNSFLRRSSLSRRLHHDSYDRLGWLRHGWSAHGNWSMGRWVKWVTFLMGRMGHGLTQDWLLF